MYGVLRAMGVTLKYLFHRSFTSDYPLEKRELAERFRGALAIRGFVSEDYEAPYRSHIAPCTGGCPAYVDARGYINLVAEEKYLEAYLLHLESNPLPATFGRICYHPCEVSCRREVEDEALSIRVIKRYFADQVFDLIKSGEIARRLKPPEQRAEKVAVIGTGPAGLSCAFYLARRGYRVTMFDKNPVPGGMMALGIPSYRLPREILKAEIDMILGLGVELKVGAALGRDFGLDELQEQGFHAVFLGIGADVPFGLGLPGEDLRGVWPGEAFLREVALGKNVKIGRTAAVIGAGNTAIDCARTARRLGADATILYRRGREEMPAHAFEIEAAIAEGVSLMLLQAPLSFHGDDRGSLKSMRVVSMELGQPDSSGRRRPMPIQGTERDMQVDSVFTAIGRLPSYCNPAGDVVAPIANYGLKYGRGKTLVVGEASGATPLNGVFAGGDVVSGPSTAIDAVYQGHRGANAIDHYIRLGTMPEQGPRPTAHVPLKSRFSWGLREIQPELDPSERATSFDEIESGFDAETVKRESERCLSCKSGNCIGCKLCATACPDRCFYIDAQQNGVRTINRFEIDHSTCCYCGLCSEACPTECLFHTRQYEFGSYSKNGLLFPKERLFRHGKGQ